MRIVLAAIAALLVAPAAAAPTCMTKAECLATDSGYCHYHLRTGQKCWYTPGSAKRSIKVPKRTFTERPRQPVEVAQPAEVPTPRPNPLLIWHEPEPTPADIVSDGFSAVGWK